MIKDIIRKLLDTIESANLMISLKELDLIQTTSSKVLDYYVKTIYEISDIAKLIFTIEYMLEGQSSDKKINKIKEYLNELIDIIKKNINIEDYKIFIKNANSNEINNSIYILPILNKMELPYNNLKEISDIYIEKISILKNINYTILKKNNNYDSILNENINNLDITKPSIGINEHIINVFKKTINTSEYDIEEYLNAKDINNNVNIHLKLCEFISKQLNNFLTILIAPEYIQDIAGKPSIKNIISNKPKKDHNYKGNNITYGKVYNFQEKYLNTNIITKDVPIDEYINIERLIYDMAIDKQKNIDSSLKRNINQYQKHYMDCFS